VTAILALLLAQFVGGLSPGGNVTISGSSKLPQIAGGTGTGSLFCTASQALTSDGSVYSCKTIINPGAVDWDSLSYPVIIAHRGGAQGAPENTLIAFRYGAALGVPLETDVQRVADGTLALMHDTTIDRTTDFTGSFTSMRLDDLLKVNVNAKFLPPDNSAAASGAPTIGTAYYPRAGVPTFDEYLQFGKIVPLIPEVKDCTDLTGTMMAQRVVALGLQKAVMIGSFCVNNLAAVRAVDPTIKTILYSGADADLAVAVANGVTNMGWDGTHTTLSNVNAAHAVGRKVFPWTYDDVTNAEAKIALGADAVITDDPAYLLNYVGPKYAPQPLTINPPIGTVGSGWRTVQNQGTNANTIIDGGGYVTFAGAATVTPVNGMNWIISPGLRVKTAAVSAGGFYQFLANVKITVAAADTTRWIALRFGCTGEMHGSSQNNCDNGYHALYRQNGNSEVYKNVAGVSTQIGSTVVWNTYTTGATFQLKVVLSATAITFTRVDTAQNNNVTDSTFDRAGYASVSASGLVPGVAQVVYQ
jgi:glycerophosphoryl diester phosphodiesterase